jgi:glycosyltransferase involved in cell wall biosynthesis
VASPEAIAAAVLAIAHNPLFAEKLGSAGRQTVQDRFTVQQQMMNYDVLYKSLT